VGEGNEQMNDITVNHIDPPQYGDERLLEWAERYMLILKIPRALSHKDLCYEHLLTDLFNYIWARGINDGNENQTER